MKEQQRTRSGGFDRRRFLVGSGALAAAATLAGPRRALAELVGEPMSIAYVEGSDRFPDLRALPWAARPAPRRPLPAGNADSWETELGSPAAVAGIDTVDAAQQLVGDQQLALSYVEMRIAGLFPALPPLGQRNVRRAQLTVVFPPLDPVFPVAAPYLAWRLERRPRVNVSPPVTFPVPLDAEGGVELVLDVVHDPDARGGAPRVHRFQSRFTVDWYDGRPKLQRGLYLLGFEPDQWASPRSLSPSRRDRPFDLASVALTIDPMDTDPDTGLPKRRTSPI